MMRVNVKPGIFRWTRERAGMDIEWLAHRFPRYPDWEVGSAQPTLRQLEKLARTVHAPIGYFFLSKPLDEPFPIPDFRTIRSRPLRRRSLNLLDTVHLCQQRQAWYRDSVRLEKGEALAFVGSVRIEDDIETVAGIIRESLSLDLEARRAVPSWTAALRQLIKSADSLGVLVMVSGTVGSNTHRKLDPEEFRGFALADDYAPLIFINGADTKAAQMFTVAHELAHLWLGQTALSDSTPEGLSSHDVETWCNRVAAEILVPVTILREEYRESEDLPRVLASLSRRFKVSTLVVLRRIFDIGGLSRDEFRSAYRAELERVKSLRKGGGGNFYQSQTVRVGDRFARALVIDTLEGGTSFTESFHLLGIRRLRTFDEFARRFGIIS